MKHTVWRIVCTWVLCKTGFRDLAAAHFPKRLVIILVGAIVLANVYPQRLHIVAPSGSLYNSLSNAEFTYTYARYSPRLRVDDAGRVVGTWYPLQHGLVNLRGALPFIWGINPSDRTVLNPRFANSLHRWGTSLALIDGKYLAFWTSVEWNFAESDYFDPYVIALYSTSEKTYDFYRQSTDHSSIWTTVNPVAHGTSNVRMLKNGSIWLTLLPRYYAEYSLYPSWRFPELMPRWLPASWQASFGRNEREFWILLPSPDGRYIFGSYRSYNNLYVVRKLLGSQEWEQLSTGSGLVPVAMSANGQYALYRQEHWNYSRAVLVDWSSRRTIDVVPPQYDGNTPVSWFVHGMSEDGRYVVGTLLKVRDSRNSESEVSRAFVWDRLGQSYYVDAKYSDCFPTGWQGRRWSATHGLAISPSGNNILIELSRPIRGANDQEVVYERIYGVLDTKASFKTPPSLVCAYRNTVDPSSAYPYEDQQIELAFFIEGDGEHYTTNNFYDITQMSTIFANQVWLVTGKQPRPEGGERKVINPAGDRLKLETVLPWTYRTSVRWYAGYPRRIYSGGRHYTIYPAYQAHSSDWVWRTRLPVGTHRFFVRVNASEEIMKLLTDSVSYQPTPGKWLPKDEDKENADWGLLWSQNCDEADELAVRVSVRARVNWANNPRRREFVEWATSFIGVPYEWGGSWYGGRSDNRPHTTNKGYGIDCSGLVCTAAQMAGYNIPRITTSELMHGPYTEPVSVAQLEPEDIIVIDGHVWIVYQIHRRRNEETGTRMECTLLHASGGDNKVVLTSAWFYANGDVVDPDRGNLPGNPRLRRIR